MDIPPRVQLPYFRDSAALPGPLPTTQEILDSAAPGRCEAKKWASNHVGIVRDVYFVKFGHSVTENEGNALIFLEKNAVDIPAPRLHAMYHMLPGKLVLVMGYTPGTNLESVWKSLSSRARASLTAELGGILKNLRELPPPADFMGGICGGPLPFRFFWTSKPNPAINGPFRREEDLGLALAEKSRTNWEFHGQPGWKTDFFHRNLSSALSGHLVKLTHSDLHPANILVRPDDSGDTSGGGQDSDPQKETRYRISAIVDWATAGWYPEYWEYAINVALFPWDGGWIEALEEMIGPFPLEAAMLHVVREDLEC